MIVDTNKVDIPELDFSYVVNKVELDILPGTPAKLFTRALRKN